MSDVTVVYLGGFGRSGSTLVERVLGSAVGWVNVGELVDLARSVAPGDELCGCGTPFSRCPFWSEVGDVAFGGWSPELLDRLTVMHRGSARQRHLPGLLAKRGEPSADLTGLRDAYARIYRAVAEVTGSDVVVDASKGPALGQALAGAPGVDLRVLNLVRDPRAVAWSWSKVVERPHVSSGSSGSSAGEEMWRIPPHRSAAQWAALQVEMHAIAGLGGTPSARLRYEDFVVDPVATPVSRRPPQLGLPLAADDLPPVVDGRIVLGPSHGLSGNPGRFRSGPIELRRDDGWATEMPSADQRRGDSTDAPPPEGVRLSRAPPPGPDPRSCSATHPEEHPVTAPRTVDLVSVVIPTRGRPGSAQGDPRVDPEPGLRRPARDHRGPRPRGDRPDPRRPVAAGPRDPVDRQHPDRRPVRCPQQRAHGVARRLLRQLRRRRPLVPGEGPAPGRAPAVRPGAARRRRRHPAADGGAR